VFNLCVIRAAQARINALRGETDSGEALDWLEATARTLGTPQHVILGLGSSALARTAAGQRVAAAALLSEVDSFPGARDDQYYSALLPGLERAALRSDDLALAEQLIAGLQSRHPYAEHALVAANAALIEARGNLDAAGSSTPMPPTAGSGSGSSPSRRSRSSVRAAVSSGSPDRTRPHPLCGTPARSSSDSRPHPSSGRPTRSFSRRPLSARRVTGPKADQTFSPSGRPPASALSPSLALPGFAAVLESPSLPPRPRIDPPGTDPPPHVPFLDSTMESLPRRPALGASVFQRSPGLRLAG
jgi:hypothetical protein